MREEWKAIPGYEGLYEVSNLGRVRSLNYRHTGKTQVLKPQIPKNGYAQVQLYNNGGKWHSVHRLAAIAFIPNSNNYPEVNHKDENKTNNRVENLEWCDRKYNCNYGSHNEKISEANKRRMLSEEARAKISKFSSKKIQCIETGQIFDSLTKAAEYLHCTPNNINKSLKRGHKAGGYHWKYIESEVI